MGGAFPAAFFEATGALLFSGVAGVDGCRLDRHAGAVAWCSLDKAALEREFPSPWDGCSAVVTKRFFRGSSKRRVRHISVSGVVVPGWHWPFGRCSGRSLLPSVQGARFF